MFKTYRMPLRSRRSNERYQSKVAGDNSNALLGHLGNITRDFMMKDGLHCEYCETRTTK